MDFIHPRKIIAVSLAALICAASLAACASVDTNSPSSPDTDKGSVTTADVTTTPEETEAPRVTPNVPDANFGGHKFTVLTRGQSSATWYSRDIYAEGITGDVISDAVYKRNAKIEDQYGFEVVEIGSNDPVK